MPSPESDALPAVQHFRRTFARIFGSLAPHAARDHRAATTLVPRTLVDGRLVPLTQSKSRLIQNSPELAHWAEDPPSKSSGKLLIIPHDPLLDNIRPRGWYAAEILNQAIPRRLHGRPTVVLHHWCRGRDPRFLIPSLIMQLISSLVLDVSPKLKLQNGPMSGLPGPYDLDKLAKRDVTYLLRTLKWLICLLKGATVYCVLDSFGRWEDRMEERKNEKFEVLMGLFELVQKSCEAGEDVDFRLLLVSPKFEEGVPRFAKESDDLREAVEECGVVLGHPRTMVKAIMPRAEDSSDDSDGILHTASEDAYYSPESDTSQ